MKSLFLKWIIVFFLPAMLAADTAGDSLKSFENKVLKAIRENDLKAARTFFLPSISQDKQFRRYLPVMWQGLQKAMLRRDFEPYVSVLSLGKIKPGDTLASEKKNHFIATFDSAGSRGALTLLVSEKDFQRYILTLLSVRQKEKWFLQFSHVGLWQVGGLDADAWFARAQKMSRRGHAVPAILAAQVAGSILRPAPILAYNKENLFEKLAEKIQKEAGRILKFPLNLLKVPGYPQVIYIEPDFDNQSLVPVVYYVSRIPLKDEKLHQATTKALLKELQIILPGITSEFKRVILRVYNEPPTDFMREYPYLNMPVNIN